MKKISLLGVLCFAFNFGLAQKQAYVAPNMPIDEDTKLITYTGVVDVPNTGKTELYKRSEAWFSSYYKNPTEVIREKDSANTKIVGKPRFKISNEPGENNVKMDAGIVQYTLTVACKDNKCKYTASEINWKQASYFPAEKWIEQKERFKQNNYFLWQTDSMMQKEIIPALEKALKSAPKKSNKDDW